MDKPTCPYCGAEMRGPTWLFSDKTYRCPRCGSVSPTSKDDSAALSAALQRYVEPNRVLTLEEAKTRIDDPIWCEFKNEIAQNDWYVGYDLVMLAIHMYDYDTFTEEAPTPAQSREMAEDDYGKTWRCWLRRPTDEEREAEGWEDTNAKI